MPAGEDELGLLHRQLDNSSRPREHEGSWSRSSSVDQVLLFSVENEPEQQQPLLHLGRGVVLLRAFLPTREGGEVTLYEVLYGMVYLCCC